MTGGTLERFRVRGCRARVLITPLRYCFRSAFGQVGGAPQYRRIDRYISERCSKVRKKILHNDFFFCQRGLARKRHQRTSLSGFDLCLLVRDQRIQILGVGQGRQGRIAAWHNFRHLGGDCLFRDRTVRRQAMMMRKLYSFAGCKAWVRRPLAYPRSSTPHDPRRARCAVSKNPRPLSAPLSVQAAPGMRVARRPPLNAPGCANAVFFCASVVPAIPGR